MDHGPKWATDRPNSAFPTCSTIPVLHRLPSTRPPSQKSRGVVGTIDMAKANLRNRSSEGEPVKDTKTKKNALAKKEKKQGRPQKMCYRPFTCPVAGCGLSYATCSGLHQHKRNKHPEMIQARGSQGSGMLRKFACPVQGCDKSYDTSAGLYQHKNSKHPELIKRR